MAREQVAWPRLVANKLLRRKCGGEKLHGDDEAEDQAKSVKMSAVMPMHGRSENVYTQSIDSGEHRIFVGTWNVAGRRPPPNLELEDWLDTPAQAADIYVLGFQEIVPLKAEAVFGSEYLGAAAVWDALIGKALNKWPRGGSGFVFRSSSEPAWSEDEREDGTVSSKPNLEELSKRSGGETYRRVVSKQMMGILITVWAKNGVRRHLRDLSVSCVGCGIMRRLGNKGSVSVRFSLHGTTFCFVCTHLASGGKKGDELRRNSDVAEILKRTYFPRFPHIILQHQRIIWFGDLNYRLALQEEEAMALVHRRAWKTLWEADQLKLEQAAGRIFQGWNEGKVDFAPTYKYAANSDEYSAAQINKDGGKRRVPAWCDRILWYGKGLKELSYGRTECRFSDHRAVRALFSTCTDIFNHRKLQKVVELSMNLAEAEIFLSWPMQRPPASYLRGRVEISGGAKGDDGTKDLYENEGYVAMGNARRICRSELLESLGTDDSSHNNPLKIS